MTNPADVGTGGSSDAESWKIRFQKYKSEVENIRTKIEQMYLEVTGYRFSDYSQEIQKNTNDAIVAYNNTMAQIRSFESEFRRLYASLMVLEGSTNTVRQFLFPAKEGVSTLTTMVSLIGNASADASTARGALTLLESTAKTAKFEINSINFDSVISKISDIDHRIRAIRDEIDTKNITKSGKSVPEKQNEAQDIKAIINDLRPSLESITKESERCLITLNGLSGMVEKTQLVARITESIDKLIICLSSAEEHFHRIEKIKSAVVSYQSELVKIYRDVKDPKTTEKVPIDGFDEAVERAELAIGDKLNSIRTAFANFIPRQMYLHAENAKEGYERKSNEFETISSQHQRTSYIALALIVLLTIVAAGCLLYAYSDYSANSIPQKPIEISIFITARLSMALLFTWTIGYLSRIRATHQKQATLYKDRKLALGIIQALIYQIKDSRKAEEIADKVMTGYLDFNRSGFESENGNSPASDLIGGMKQLGETLTSMMPVAKAARELIAPHKSTDILEKGQLLASKDEAKEKKN